MSPVHGKTFATLFDGLDARDQRGFVADLYAARGWDIRLDEGSIAATQEGETRRIAVVQPGRFGTPPLPDVDMVVVARDKDAIRTEAEDAGVDYVTTDDLRNLLLYGLNRETAADLFEDHFDRPLSSVESTAGAAEDATSLTSLPSSLDWNTRRAGVVVVLLVITGGLVGAGLLPNTEPENTSLESTLTYTPGGVGAIGGERTYPPGLGPDGVENSGTLTEAHFQYLDNKSYVYRIGASGPPHAQFMLGLGAWNATVRIANGSHYQYRKRVVAPYGFRVEQRALPQGNVTDWDPKRAADADNESEPESLTKRVYADGTNKFWRFDGPEEVVYRRASVAQQGDRIFGIVDQVAWVDIYLQRFLWAENSTVRCLSKKETGDCDTYRVEVTGDPVELRGDVADYRAVAVVESSGFVRSLSVRYTIPRLDNPDERVQARFHLKYVEVGTESVSISPPEWLDTAKNRTEGTDTETPHETDGTTTNSTDAE